MVALPGHSLLVGLTFMDLDASVRERRQFLGEVLEAPPGGPPGLYVRAPEGAAVAVPADAAAVLPAPRGVYRCLVTGETFTDPDLITSWRVIEPPGAAARWQANYAPLVRPPVPDEWDFTYRHDPAHLRHFLDTRGGDYAGRRVRVLLRVYVEAADGAGSHFVGEEERAGRIARASYAEGVVVTLESGKEFRLPPDLSLLQPLPSGDAAGQPAELITRWTVVRSAEEDES